MIRVNWVPLLLLICLGSVTAQVSAEGWRMNIEPKKSQEREVIKRYPNPYYNKYDKYYHHYHSPWRDKVVVPYPHYPKRIQPRKIIYIMPDGSRQIVINGNRYYKWQEHYYLKGTYKGKKAFIQVELDF